MLFSQLVQTTEHVRLHLEGCASVLAHQLHRVGVVVQVGGHGIFRVELHVGQGGGHTRWRRRGLEREAGRGRRGKVGRIGGHVREWQGSAEVLRAVGGRAGRGVGALRGQGRLRRRGGGG